MRMVLCPKRETVVTAQHNTSEVMSSAHEAIIKRSDAFGVGLFYSLSIKTSYHGAVKVDGSSSSSPSREVSCQVLSWLSKALVPDVGIVFQLGRNH